MQSRVHGVAANTASTFPRLTPSKRLLLLAFMVLCGSSSAFQLVSQIPSRF